MMAKDPNTITIPSEEAQDTIINYARRVLTEHRKFQDILAKMEVIDQAYARYQLGKDSNGLVPGEGIDAATTPVGVVNMPSTVPPVLVSQVDSMVGYLADVFLSGTPLFPVVSSPDTMQDAEKLETLVDDHATIGGYARQLLMFFKDTVKYNFGAIELSWETIEQYSVLDELLAPGTKKLQKSSKSYNRLRRIDPYNTVWDHNVQAGDVAERGDYAGYIEILSHTKLKRLLNRLGNSGKAFNIKEAMLTTIGLTPNGTSFYRIHPQVSDYVMARKPISGMNWYTYITGLDPEISSYSGDNFELFTLYARILPSDFRLSSPAKNTPQIWKFLIVNSTTVISAERIVSAYDYLPMLFGQPLEDGLGYQTQSIAEGSIPFQEAAKTLFNIRFNSARRAVSDRALYDASLISPSDINAPVPAAKIPVKTNSLDGNRRIQDAYYQIPFDPRGTETALQDGMTLIGFGKELSGLNSPMQGQFQKGNKSVQEWNDTMGGADARLRLPALCLEYQVFQPLKQLIVLNIYQYGDNVQLVSQKTGTLHDIDINELRKKVLSFRVADGYTPKSKLAGTEAIQGLMTILGQSQPLQQAYGSMLPLMFAHLAQLLGVRDLAQYSPKTPQNLPAQPQVGQAPAQPVQEPSPNPPIEGQQG